MRFLLLIYNLFIRLYFIAIRLAALDNKKAALWIQGRKNVFQYLEQNIAPADQIIWMHCSSAGEFEQGKPVIEALKTAYPYKKILVSFFSPSGYAVARSYPHADFFTYLPLDTRQNAERFFRWVKPELVIFVKYEFWYHHLAVAAFHHVPLVLISAVFRKEQVFFKPYGKFFRQMLHLFRHIFVQDNVSLQLLQAHGIKHCSISGDTRFDRVMQIVENFTAIPFIENLLPGHKSIVAGSTWEEDEQLLKEVWDASKQNGLKLIIAPHEIHQKHLNELATIFPEAVYLSSFGNGARNETSADVIIVDSVGLLSRLYRYATITYVGGGFTKDGIHNILEAAVWGKPVIFGPNYKKYREAKEMIASGGALSVATAEELKKLAGDLLSNEDQLQAMSRKAKNYVDENTGATQSIITWLQEKRLLTN